MKIVGIEDGEKSFTVKVQRQDVAGAGVETNSFPPRPNRGKDPANDEKTDAVAMYAVDLIQKTYGVPVTGIELTAAAE